MLAVAQHVLAVDEDVLDARGVLVRSLEGAMVLDGPRVEHHHVSVVAGRQASASRSIAASGLGALEG